MNRAAPAPVIVAVDDAGSADDALSWAAAEAAARHSPLRVVHASDSCLSVDPSCIRAALEQSTAARAAAEAVLRDAAALASTVVPDLEVTTRLMEGRATWALRQQAREAQLLVLGKRGRPGLWGLFAASVSSGLATHACCPVIVLRHREDRPASVACVVVGVERGSSCTAAIGFAFQAAAQRGIPLRVVHVSRRRSASRTRRRSGHSPLTDVLADSAVARTLARWRDEFPDVPVLTKLVDGDPAAALIAEAAGAALLVVGSRGHRIGRSLGPVARTALEHAQCPIAVVRHDAALTARADAEFGGRSLRG